MGLFFFFQMEIGYHLPSKWPKLLDMTKDECRKALRALGEKTVQLPSIHHTISLPVILVLITWLNFNQLFFYLHLSSLQNWQHTVRWCLYCEHRENWQRRKRSCSVICKLCSPSPWRDTEQKFEGQSTMKSSPPWQIRKYEKTTPMLNVKQPSG